MYLMKRRNRPSDTLSNINKLSSRRSLIDKTILKMIAATAVIIGGVIYKLELKYPSAPSAASVNFNKAPRNFQDLIHILEAEFGYNVQMTFKEARKSVEVDNDIDSDNELGLGTMTKTFAGKVCDTVCSLWNEKEEALLDLAFKAHGASEYTENYQLSEEKMAIMDPEKFDCNDRARRACQRLERHGIPMYFLNLWPSDPELRLDEDSHQVAVCKLQENEYLICDNDKIIFWRGSLTEFVRQYHDDDPGEPKMGIMAAIGISKYREPDDESFYTKSKTQYLMRTTEKEMRSINIPIKPPTAPGYFT